jgi:hypothetical protein
MPTQESMSPDSPDKSRAAGKLNVPSQSTSALNTEMCQSESPLAQAQLVSNEQFADTLARSLVSALDKVRRFDMKSGLQGVPSALKDLVSDAAMRAGLWQALAQEGMPTRSSFSREQTQALIVALLPYWKQDGPNATTAALRAALEEGCGQPDHALYKILGEACACVDIDPVLLKELSVPFNAFSCLNVEQDSDLKAWSNVFSAQADESVLVEIAIELECRLFHKQFSGYDHLLTALCNAQNEAGLNLLADLVQPESRVGSKALVALRSLLSSVAREVAVFGAIGVAGGYLSLFVSPAAAIAIVGIASLSRVLYTRVVDKAARDEEAQWKQFKQEFLEGYPHRHFVELLYAKLLKLAPASPAAEALLKSIDDTPRYAHLKEMFQREAS